MSKVFYEEENEPIVLSKPLFDLLLKQEKFAELIALYSFYYYTAKWQKTNTPKAVNSYVARGLQWGGDKVKKYKKQLIELGLLETVRKKNETTNQIIGHYIKVNFIWSKDHPLLQEKAIGVKIHPVANNTTNALSTGNINALNTNKEEDVFVRGDEITPKLFEEFWTIYPRKTDKGKALTIWNRICTRKNGLRPNWREIRKAIIEQKRSDRWQDKQFIPLPATWLNQSRWLDDPNEMKSFDYNKNDSNKFDKNKSKFEPMFDEVKKSTYHKTNYD